MNLPTSSTRGFFEILMPGIFLLFNVLISLYVITLTVVPNSSTILNQILKTFANPALSVALFIVLGYPIGVVLRLLKNANIDSRSARYIKLLHPKLKESIFLNEPFFFNNWMHKKATERLPNEVVKFYEEFWLDKDTKNGSHNTTFFNFCKSVISKFDQQSGNEIAAAEALSRFLAGSYYALRTSLILMLINSIFLIKFISIQTAMIPIMTAIGYGYLLHVILSEYRLLRAKEVDIVFNASFVNREYFEKLLPDPIGRKLKSTSTNIEYELRSKLIKDAWIQKEKNGQNIASLELEKLISLMKKESQIHPFLSSIYFAGGLVDHQFFLENNKIALGIAVMPEDSEKANRIKRHPHQIEFIVVLKGSIKLHFGENEEISEIILHENDYYVINKGTCHWVSQADDEKNAAYLFVKTNPTLTPRSETCEK